MICTDSNKVLIRKDGKLAWVSLARARYLWAEKEARELFDEVDILSGLALRTAKWWAEAFVVPTNVPSEAIEV